MIRYIFSSAIIFKIFSFLSIRKIIDMILCIGLFYFRLMTENYLYPNLIYFWSN